MIYEHEYLNEISFPLGGIGTGCVGLAGNGCLVDWEIFNRPNKGMINPYSFFLVKAEKPDGTSLIKILQGDTTTNLTGLRGRTNYSGFGYGPRPETMCALPHFRNVVFDGAFPMATLTFTDPDFPAEVVMEAYNPFIPHDSKNSSLPLAFFRIRIKSHEEGIHYTVIFSAMNPFKKTLNHSLCEDGSAMVFMEHAECDREDEAYGDMTIAVKGDSLFTETYWYRTHWLGKDGMTTFWREITEGEISPREYDEPSTRDVASVGARITPAASEETSLLFSLTWNVPNCGCVSDIQRCEDPAPWKNYYATLFEDSAATARYALAHEADFYTKTKAFSDLLQRATLDPAVIDAVSSTISVLKSPTVLRLTDGALWGWEGVASTHGSCEGTCTHVWSYAYALCFLFPDLERSIRETEFRYDVYEDGKMAFRTTLPLGATPWRWRACLDGQMATVIKVYRDFKITGDSEWLRTHWQAVKSILAYAWSEENPDAWDRDRDGVLEGRQHHTLDLELFGPSAWLEGMYLAALRAGEEMARYLGDTEAEALYRSLFEKGYDYTKEQLFNGEYFIHRVDMNDPTPTERFEAPEYWNAEKGELKFQIGDGCEIDQLLGQWHAALTGLGDIFDPAQRKTALSAMYRYLYKPSLREFPNMWRVFAVNDEGGAVMCEFPEGAYRPFVPVLYSDECMTGFEYAFAGLLISEGFMEEGLSVVRSIRDRYDGKKRNPWNEIECGSNYARAMASFALLPIFSGMEYDLSVGHLGFSPLLGGDFRCPFGLGSALGEFVATSGETSLSLLGGSLTLRTLRIGNLGTVSEVLADGRPVPFEQNGDTLSFPETTFAEQFVVIA